MDNARVYEFGQFRLEPAERQLLRAGRLVALTPKAFETLHALVAGGGRAVSKDDLMRAVWPDTNVSDATLSQNIFALRKALGEAEWIETVPKFGYRFVPPVRSLSAAVGKIVLAVLPFENLSGDPEQEYFSDGLTEEMITQLGRLNPRRIGVIARTSAMRYKLTNKTVAEIGHELGVAYVVEGSVRRAGSRVRVTAQLVQVQDQTHVWAESYERRFDDILMLQSDLARAVAKEIDVTLTPSEARRLARAPAISPLAHEAYLKGRYFWNNRTEDGLKKGIEFFHDAIAHEPDFAAAYDGISDCYVMLACRGVLPARETFQRARTAAGRALELDGALGEGHASMAHVRLHDWDWDGLDDDFRRALELDPGHAIAYYWYSEYLMAVGRADESIAMVQTAHRMDPLSSVLSASLGMILYLARRYEQSLAGLRKALEIQKIPNTYTNLAIAYAGAIPMIVARSCSTIRHCSRKSGYKGFPSIITTDARARSPDISAFQIIQAVVLNQKIRSSGPMSHDSTRFFRCSIRIPPWQCTIAFGSPVVPEEKST